MVSIKKNPFTSTFVLFLFLSALFIPISSSYEHENAEDLNHSTAVQPVTSPIGGCRYSIQGWIYVNIQGDPYERGYQYGYLVADEIIDLMYRWSHMILNHPKIKPIRLLLSTQRYDSLSEKWWTFCTNTADRMYWEQYPMEYQEEIKGIAAGVNQRGVLLYGRPLSYKDVLASNEMYEMLSKLTDRKVRKGIHPLYSLFDAIKPDLDRFISISADTFVSSSFVNDVPIHHHCSSFIATGNATRYGEVIIANSMWSSKDGAGMWWWSHYISIRWNVVLDVIPTQGHRFQMTCAPGYIWSDHDFYQNSKGIVFIETTLPQGIWSEKGLPLAVRARTAVQYAESIDEVIDYLRTNNDGVMNAVWLIGDTNTGEIARYELGLFHDAVVYRGFDGFHWSSNNPMDFWVRMEKLDVKLLMQRLVYYLLLGAEGYEYHTPWYVPAARDITFEQLGQQHYGEIDIEIVKDIMSTDPISTYSPDCKITSSTLLEQQGIIVFTGNPSGRKLPMANFDSPEEVWEEIRPNGWLRLFGRPQGSYGQENRFSIDVATEPEVLWEYHTSSERNDHVAKSILVDDVLYSSTSDGKLLAIDAERGYLLWEMEIGRNPTRPIHLNNSLFIGTYEGLKKLDLGWMMLGEKPLGTIVSPPVASEDMIYVGTEDGRLSAFSADDGSVKWQVSFPGEIWLSEPRQNILIVCSGADVFGLNRTDGSIIWTYKTSGPITMQPVISDGVVYVGSWDAALHAVSIAEGQLLWKKQTGFGIETTPFVTESNVIFCSHDGTISAVNKTSGEDQWRKSTRSAMHVSPLLMNQRIYVASDDGRMYCLDSKNGDPYWIFAPERTLTHPQRNYFTTPICSNIVGEESTIYVSVKGTFYALQG